MASASCAVDLAPHSPACALLGRKADLFDQMVCCVVKRLVPSGFKALASGAVACLALAGLGVDAPRAQADAGSTSGFEFRWDSQRDYRKLYYFISSGRATARSDYYLVLSPKDRKTALIKLAIAVPKDFDTKLDPKAIELCFMNRGGVREKTGCKEVIPATVEVSADSTAVEIFPDRPVPTGKSIGVHMRLYNPFNPGMYQFNALGQAPGDVPVSGYLGSWVIEISPET